MISPHVLSTSYDNEWEIRITPQNYHGPFNVPGAFIGNGKIGVVVSLDKIGAERCSIAYDKGCCPCFDSHSFSMESAAQHEYMIDLTEQRLDMYSGIVMSSFSAKRGLDRHMLTVETFVAKHMPYTHVQKITFIPDEDIPALHMYHTLRAPESFEKVEYNNNTVFNERARSNRPVYLLSGKAKVPDRGLKLATCSCYIADCANMSVMGFNIDAKDRKVCHQRLNLYDLKKGLPYVFHVITTQITTDDCKEPLEEAKRIQMSIMSVAEPAARVRTQHVVAWANAWRHNVVVEPRGALSAYERDRVHRVNKVLRLSLFTVWSSVRDAAITGSIPFVDMDGSLEGECDLWLLPLLVILRPSLAKNMLEKRHDMLQDAIRLAAGYGYSGSKFPCPHEGAWDATGAMHIYNTALVSVNVWNYYRVTLDKNWLSNKGYAMLKNNADFFASRAELDAASNTYSIRNVMSMNGTEEDNNTMTNYLAIMAMRYAVEASFELGLAINPEWHAVMQKLALCKDTPSGMLLLANDSKDKKEFALFDHLLPLLPLFSDVYFRAHLGKTADALRKNVAHSMENASMAHVDHVFNKMMVAWLKATALDLDTDHTVHDIMDAALGPVWENFQSNASLAAMFVLMIMTSFGTLRIAGCVTETRFYTERMGVKVSPTNVMPKLWKGLRLSGVGASPVSTHYVVNTSA